MCPVTCTPELAPFLNRVRFSRRQTKEAEQVLASLASGSDEQIIAIVKEQEAGIATTEVCRRHGISGATFYEWKSKYSGLEVSEPKRLRSVDDENAKLKRLLAEAMLGVDTSTPEGFRKSATSPEAPSPCRSRPLG